MTGACAEEPWSPSHGREGEGEREKRRGKGGREEEEENIRVESKTVYNN